MILAALAIMFNLDKALQVKLLDLFPSYGSALNIIEDNEAIREKIELLEEDTQKKDENKKNMKEEIQENTSKNKTMDHMGIAPEFQGISNWLNTESSLTQEELKGKVVLIDFWTYSCINCIRTLPHVTGWYEKYKDDGFVIVGVHTPEFAFEHSTKNVQQALERYDITYPVAQDNNYETWRAYKNRYWPAHYLIDAEGNIRYTHFGEGKYDVTEQAIQDLLQEAKLIELEKELLRVSTEKPQSGQTPETYLGYGRIERFMSPESIQKDQARIYSFPDAVEKDSFGYNGKWTIEKERSVSEEDARLKIVFSGSRVFLVMSPPENREGLVEVYLDGEVIKDQYAGKDIVDGIVKVSEERLYELIRLEKVEEHELELHFNSPGTSVYAFTFG